MLYKNYIFDLYGTLADILTDEEDPELWRRTSLWYSRHGAEWTSRELRESYLVLCNTEQNRLSDPLAEIELRNVFRDLFTAKGAAADSGLVEEAARVFRACSLKKLTLYPWVLPAFEKLRKAGSGIYLLSNAQACFTEGELQTLGIADAFDGIVLSSDAGFKKPSPKILKLLMERFGLSAETCLMTGNDPDADIAMAAAAGIDTLYLKTETSPDRPAPPFATYALEDEDYSRMDALLGIS